MQPPACNSVSRRRRDTANDNTVKGVEGLDGGTPATIEVYSGLYVNEASDIGSKSDYSEDVFRERVRPINIHPCFRGSRRKKLEKNHNSKIYVLQQI